MAYTQPTAGASATATAADTNWKESSLGLYAYGSTGGTASAITLTPSPAITAYVAGQTFRAKITTTNARNATLNVSGVGAVNLYLPNGDQIPAGYLLAGSMAEFEYDGTNMQVISAGGGIDPMTARAISRSAMMIAGLDTQGYAGSALYPGGYSDAATKVISMFSSGSNGCMMVPYGVATDYGVDLYMTNAPSVVSVTTNVIAGMLIGTDSWISKSDNTLYKNGAAITWSGGSTPRYGSLGHNPTLSYMLILTSSTNIKRYSGIAGTTLTFVDTITLDTAVTVETMFAYDDANSRYICIDKTNNLIRRFSSTGVTVDTVAYTVDDTKVVGVTIIGGRVYLVTQHGGAVTSNSPSSNMSFINNEYIPTNMVI